MCCICFDELKQIYKFREKCLTAETLRNESVKVEELDIVTKIEPEDVEETFDYIPENVVNEPSPDVATEKRFICGICGKAFLDWNSWKIHLNNTCVHKKQAHGTGRIWMPVSVLGCVVVCVLFCFFCYCRRR